MRKTVKLCAVLLLMCSFMPAKIIAGNQASKVKSKSSRQAKYSNPGYQYLYCTPSSSIVSSDYMNGLAPAMGEFNAMNDADRSINNDMTVNSPGNSGMIMSYNGTGSILYLNNGINSPTLNSTDPGTDSELNDMGPAIGSGSLYSTGTNNTWGYSYDMGAIGMNYGIGSGNLNDTEFGVNNGLGFNNGIYPGYVGSDMERADGLNWYGTGPDNVIRGGTPLGWNNNTASVSVLPSGARCSFVATPGATRIIRVLDDAGLSSPTTTSSAKNKK